MGSVIVADHFKENGADQILTISVVPSRTINRGTLVILMMRYKDDITGEDHKP